MSFGYIGDTSTSIKQQVKNAGVLSVNDVLDLKGKGQLGGSLELIEEQTISTDTTIDFTSILENVYDVHYLTFENMSMTAPGGNQIPYYRLSNDGGSTFESTNYESTGQFNTAGGTGTALTRVTTYGHLCGNQQSNYKWNGYVYFYNLGNSSKYSFSTFHTVGVYSANSKQSTTFGASAYRVEETVNGIRLAVDGSTSTLAGGTAKLYGVKQT